MLESDEMTECEEMVESEVETEEMVEPEVEIIRTPSQAIAKKAQVHRLIFLVQ